MRWIAAAIIGVALSVAAYAQHSPAPNEAALRTQLQAQRAAIANPAAANWDAALTSLERAAGVSALASDEYETGMAIGQRAFAENQYESARVAYAHAYEAASSDQGPRSVAAGRALWRYAASLIMEIGGNRSAQTALIRAMEILRTDEATWDTEYAQSMAWQAASASAQAGAGQSFLVPSRNTAAVGGESCGGRLVNRPNVRWSAIPQSDWPTQGGGVVVRFDVGDDGQIVGRRIVAVAPNNDLMRAAVEEVYARWSFERGENDRTDCMWRAGSRFIPIRFGARIERR